MIWSSISIIRTSACSVVSTGTATDCAVAPRSSSVTVSVRLKVPAPAYVRVWFNWPFAPPNASEKLVNSALALERAVTPIDDGCLMVGLPGSVNDPRTVTGSPATKNGTVMPSCWFRLLKTPNSRDRRRHVDDANRRLGVPGQAVDRMHGFDWNFDDARAIELGGARTIAMIPAVEKLPSRLVSQIHIRAAGVIRRDIVHELRRHDVVFQRRRDRSVLARRLRSASGASFAGISHRRRSRVLVEPDVRADGANHRAELASLLNPKCSIEVRAFEVPEVVPVVLLPVEEIDDHVSSGEVAIRIQLHPRLCRGLLAQTRERRRVTLVHRELAAGGREDRHARAITWGYPGRTML